MMLHGGNHHLITGLQEFPAVRRCNQVDALGGAAGKQALVIVFGIDELAHFFASVFVGLGRLLAQVVDSPMDVCVLPGIVLGQAVDDALRLLGRCSAIQVHQGITFDLAIEYREIPADFFNVEWSCLCVGSQLDINAGQIWAPQRSWLKDMEPDPCISTTKLSWFLWVENTLKPNPV